MHSCFTKGLLHNDTDIVDRINDPGELAEMMTLMADMAQRLMNRYEVVMVREGSRPDIFHDMWRSYATVRRKAKFLSATMLGFVAVMGYAAK